MKKNTMKIAMCGISGALIVSILLMGFIFPFATYACPAIAACILMPICFEYGKKASLTLYLATSLLALILIPDYELSFMYIFVFGLYTAIKIPIDRIKGKYKKLGIKFAFINISIFVSYGILLFIFPMQALINEFSEYGRGFLILLIVMMNIMFFLYDKAVEKILILYVYKLRKRLFNK